MIRGSEWGAFWPCSWGRSAFRGLENKFAWESRGQGPFGREVVPPPSSGAASSEQLIPRSPGAQQGPRTTDWGVTFPPHWTSRAQLGEARKDGRTRTRSPLSPSSWVFSSCRLVPMDRALWCARYRLHPVTGPLPRGGRHHSQVRDRCVWGEHACPLLPSHPDLYMYQQSV